MHADHTGDEFYSLPHRYVNNHNVEPTNQPVSKGQSHTILKSTEEKKRGWNQENPCVWKPWANKWEVREGEQLPGGREFAVRGCSATRGEEGECLREGKNSKIMGRVCMWVRTDSPTTPLPKTINCLNHQQPFFMKVVGLGKGRRHMDFYPIGQGLTNSPTSLSLWKSCPFLILVTVIVAGQVHLINYRCIFTWWQT